MIVSLTQNYTVAGVSSSGGGGHQRWQVSVTKVIQVQDSCLTCTLQTQLSTKYSKIQASLSIVYYFNTCTERFYKLSILHVLCPFFLHI